MAGLHQRGGEDQRVAHPFARIREAPAFRRAAAVQLTGEVIEALVVEVTDHVDRLTVAAEAVHPAAHRVGIAEHYWTHQPAELKPGDGVQRSFIVALRKDDDAAEPPSPVLHAFTERDHRLVPSLVWSASSTCGATNSLMSPPSDAISRTNDADR